MYERLNKCPLCKSGLFLNHQIIKDHSISQESFVVCKCNSCGLLFTNPRPHADQIDKYYASEDYISHQDNTKNLIHLVYKIVRRITIRQKVTLINKLKPKKGRLLDYGAGTGYFLNAAIKEGWNGVGYEPNSTAVKIAKENFGLTFFSDLKSVKEEKKFDVITLFHVLEHVHELRKTIKLLLNKLKSTGIICVALPNTASLDAVTYNQTWAAWDVPRHLYHFDQKSVEFLAKEFDLKIISRKPMLFDSYYVSWLSENFQENNLFKKAFTAFRNGWNSNKAAKEDKNYSSILYILKKK